MQTGVRAAHLQSVFPAESFPAWQTLQTGLLPESHGIVANTFYDQQVHQDTKRECSAFFNSEDEARTGHAAWWQRPAAAPIWATAARHGKSFATFLWSRCDIPYGGFKQSFSLILQNYTCADGIRPAHCDNVYSTDRTKTLTHNLDMALLQLQSGVDAAIVSLFMHNFLLLKSSQHFLH